MASMPAPPMGTMGSARAASAPMGRRLAASVDWATGGDDRELDAGRQQVREEVRRMRKAGPLGDVERREWLADLATRLKALVRHLRNQVPASALALLNELVDAIEAGGAVDGIWDEAVTVLDAFAAGVGVAKPGR